MRSCCVFDSLRLLHFPLFAVHLLSYHPVIPPGHQLDLPRCGGQIHCALQLMTTLAPLPSTTLSHIDHNSKHDKTTASLLAQLDDADFKLHDECVITVREKRNVHIFFYQRDVPDGMRTPWKLLCFVKRSGECLNMESRNLVPFVDLFKEFKTARANVQEVKLEWTCCAPARRARSHRKLRLSNRSFRGVRL